MKVVAVIWLIAALGFVISVGGLFANRPWWRPFLWVTLVMSTAIIALEWPRPIVGGYINAGILMALVLSHRLRLDRGRRSPMTKAAA